MFSPVPVEYTDIDFLKVVYDESKHETHLVTLYYEQYPRELAQSLDASAAADREGNKPLLSLYTFNREFQSGLISFDTNATHGRVLH